MRLEGFSRRHYGAGPTRIEFLPRLTGQLGGPRVYIKRDDTLGLLGGGNKTRKLEFLMADAAAKGADAIVTCGAVQSNHCRLALSAAAREGLAGHLVLEERGAMRYDPDASGNAFLYHLLGVASITLVESAAAVEPAMERVAERLRAEGHRPYVIPGGGSNGLGALGYAACAQEVLAQAGAMGIAFDTVVVASGGGGTQAGLVAGFESARPRVRVLGVSVKDPEAAQRAVVQDVLGQIAETLGEPLAAPDEAVWCTDAFVGPGYAQPTPEMAEAVELLARLEGILLDPVYTGKAMAALIGLVRQGRFAADANLLFLHTGGAPALFAHTDAFLARWRAHGASAVERAPQEP